MKQVYKKKPEYLDVVFVADDTQSIKEVYEVAGVINASINFDENGESIFSEEFTKPDTIVLGVDANTASLINNLRSQGVFDITI